MQGEGLKRLVVRAMGPSLPVDAPLADPTLEVYDSQGSVIYRNDDWESSSDRNEIADRGLAPPFPKEAAVLVELPSGAYTAIVSGTSRTVGTALIEVYDIDQTASAQVANISTRGLVQTGDDVMIAGVILTGDQPTRLLLRAIGPSLSGSATVKDPVIELFDASGHAIAINNDWKDTQRVAITATGLAPESDLESAILVTLEPNNYTAVVRNRDGTPGLGLVEVYKLPPAP